MLLTDKVYIARLSGMRYVLRSVQVQVRLPHDERCIQEVSFLLRDSGCQLVRLDERDTAVMCFTVGKAKRGENYEWATMGLQASLRRFVSGVNVTMTPSTEDAQTSSFQDVLTALSRIHPAREPIVSEPPKPPTKKTNAHLEYLEAMGISA